MHMSLTALIRRTVPGIYALLLLPVALGCITVGCTGQEPSLSPQGQGEVAETGAGGPAGLELGSRDSSRGAATELETNLALPVLVPAFGLEGSTTECKFTDDPYNTCI
jgi:hypothetical protein